jgi:hypothetical protein
MSRCGGGIVRSAAASRTRRAGLVGLRYRALRFLALLFVSLGGMASTQAHTLSESLSAWRIDGDTVRLQFTVPDLEARRITASGKDLPSSGALGQYLAARLGATAGTHKCPLTEGPRALAASAGY